MSSCLVILMFVLQETDTRDELRAVIRDIRRNRTDPAGLFQGMEVRSTTITRRKNESDTPWLETTCNVLEESVWRCDIRDNDNSTSVFVRDGNFSFDAYENSQSGRFEFGLLGYGAAKLAKVTDSSIERNRLVDATTRIMGTDLLKLLELSNFSVVSIQRQESEIGRKVKIEWNLEPTAKFASSYGDAILLSEHGYLIEKANFHFGQRSDAQSPDRHFWQSSEFKLMNDEFLPFQSTQAEPNVSFVCSLVSSGATNQGRSFYKAEALGLKTPTNPKIVGIVWFAIGCLSLLFAWWFFWRRKSA